MKSISAPKTALTQCGTLARRRCNTVRSSCYFSCSSWHSLRYGWRAGWKRWHFESRVAQLAVVLRFISQKTQRSHRVARRNAAHTNDEDGSRWLNTIDDWWSATVDFRSSGQGEVFRLSIRQNPYHKELKEGIKLRKEMRSIKTPKIGSR